MKLERTASADEMVREFVLAEIRSARTGFRFAGCDRALAAASIADSQACQARASWLARTRGWPDTLIFDGFPADTAWWWADLDGSEAVYLMGYVVFEMFTDGTRLPHDFAPNDGRVAARAARFEAAYPQHVKEYLGIVASAREYAAGGDLSR